MVERPLYIATGTEAPPEQRRALQATVRCVEEGFEALLAAYPAAPMSQDRMVGTTNLARACSASSPGALSTADRT